MRCTIVQKGVVVLEKLVLTLLNRDCTISDENVRGRLPKPRL